MKLSDYMSLFKDEHLNLYRIGYTNRAGIQSAYTLASRENAGPKCMRGRLGSADAVVIVPFHRERGQLVIIREFRVALGGFQYGFPAGLIDPGESVEMAVERELLEETGLTVLRHLRQSPVVFTSSGITDESVVMAYVACSGDPSDSGNSTSELIETHFVDPATADGLCRDHRILMDVKTWLVLSGFAANGSVE
jgi:ADP-ribose pyrophosphatase